MKDNYEVIVAGGGPAGSVAAMLLARAGFSVCVLEKDQHPRFHVGESILPRTTPLLRELGLEHELHKLTHVPKYGAEFGFGDDHKTRKFYFADGFLPGTPVFNIERAHFDKMLLDQAGVAGAEVYEQTPVTAIRRLEHNSVEVETAGRTITGRVFLDASGHGTLVGRALNLRRNFEDPVLQKVAYFQHFDGVERPPGDESGHPTIIMCDEGWFWLIGLSDTKTSVGFVTRPSFVRTLKIPPRELLMWAASRCPVVRHRLRNAVGSPENEILSDFSYRCRPYAGPGYFMIGDAACFLDPIFSTGATLAMMSAQNTARIVADMLRGTLAPQEAQARHCRFIEQSTAPFWRLIRDYYRHSFRELFMNGGGPLQMPGAIISILAGQVFPQAPWSLRWRHRVFDLCVRLQEHIALAPHRRPFRLVDEPPATLPLAQHQSKGNGGAPISISALPAPQIEPTLMESKVPIERPVPIGMPE